MLQIDNITVVYTMVIMKTVLNVKTDTDVKKKAQKLAKDLGVPLSTIVNAMLKQFIEEQKITLRKPLKPSKKLEKILAEIEEDRKHGRNFDGPFHSPEEVQEYLDSLKKD